MKFVIKKVKDFNGNIICNLCKKDENTINCLNCGELFHKRNSKRKFCSRKCSNEYIGKTVLSGRKLSKETKEKLSKIATGHNNGLFKTKYYSIFRHIQINILMFKEHMNLNMLNI